MHCKSVGRRNTNNGVTENGGTSVGRYLYVYDLSVFNAEYLCIFGSHVDMTLCDDNALGKLNFAARANELNAGSVCGVAGFAYGNSLEAESTSVGVRYFDLVSRSCRTENAEHKLGLGSNNLNLFFASELTGLGKILLVCESMTCTEKCFDGSGGKMHVTCGGFNDKVCHFYSSFRIKFSAKAHNFTKFIIAYNFIKVNNILIKSAKTKESFILKPKLSLAETVNAENTGEKNEKTEQIKEFSGITVSLGDKKIECISIIGLIEGHYLVGDNQKTTKYEHVLPLLLSAEQDPLISGIIVLINTMGGDVEAGLAISEMIASMRKPTVSLVLGGSHSIGVPLAVSCKRSFIVPSATMMIHPVRITGTVIGAPQTFYYFEKMQERITKFVSNHSRISKERFSELMMQTDEIASDVGSIINGEQAVSEGLIDSLGGLCDALEAIKEMAASTHDDK